MKETRPPLMWPCVALEKQRYLCNLSARNSLIERRRKNAIRVRYICMLLLALHKMQLYCAFDCTIRLEQQQQQPPPPPGQAYEMVRAMQLHAESRGELGKMQTYNVEVIVAVGGHCGILATAESARVLLPFLQRHNSQHII